MRNPYQSPAIEQGLRAFANANMLPGTGNLPEFLTGKRRACFIKIDKDKVIRNCMVHYLKDS